MTSIRPNIIDKFIAVVAPKYGVARLRSRYMFGMLSGGYKGASKNRDATTGWQTRTQDADSDILLDLPTLRERSRDLARNNPIACGAINTKVSNVVGTGLKLNSSIDRKYLGMSDDEADEWENAAEREFSIWAQSQNCDVEGTLAFIEHQELSWRATLENGDHFVLMTKVKNKDSIYDLALQHIEADRVCNENNAVDSQTLVAGVEKSKEGKPLYYHVLEGHPGSRYAKSMKWKKLPAFGLKTGRRITLHLFHKLRAGQTRGVPDLAPVIEPLKQLDRYTDAEIDAAVKTALFALLIKTETGDGLAGLNFEEWKDGRKEYYKESPINMKDGSSVAVGLFPDDEVTTFDPSRPNTAYDPFMKAMYVHIGMALDIPAEVMTKHFQSSYSAARAALLQAWQFVIGRRGWLATKFCQPVYEAFLTEAISKNKLSAPGFFSDPSVRAAYCGAEWIGDAQGQIDETKAVAAAADRIDLGVSNKKREAAALTGEDYDKIRRQREKERRQDVGEESERTERSVQSAEELDQADRQESING